MSSPPSNPSNPSNRSNRKKEALEFHSKGRPGKIQVVPTKPLTTQRDLSLAYSPGVAEPCMEIFRNPADVYKYTARGNLVDVDAAMEGLEAGRLSALGLDVYPLEPWPRLSAAAERPELMLTPHAAGYHDGLPEALREELVATVERWLKAQGKGV